jgi:hypothetical protein
MSSPLSIAGPGAVAMRAGHVDAEGALRGRLVANGHEFAPRTEGVAEQEAFLKAMDLLETELRSQDTHS